jgi:hypothetical protein
MPCAPVGGVLEDPDGDLAPLMGSTGVRENEQALCVGPGFVLGVPARVVFVR